jgi:hypothetical protein
VLTTAETVPAAFAGASYRDDRRGLATRVRHLGLGLGPAERRPAPTTDAGALAVLAMGGALDLDVAPCALDEDALAAAGRALDEQDPDAFERAWRTVGPDDVAVIGDGGAQWTHADITWAVHSVAQHLGAEPGVRLQVSSATAADGIDGVRRLVLTTLLPALTGVELVDDAADVVVWSATEVVPVARALVTSLPTGRLRRRGARADGRGRLGLDRCRLALVTGSAGVAVDWLLEVGVRAEPLETVAGCAAPVRAARPLPGVTVAVDDDGEVLVRSGATAAGRAVDGWLRTGWFE